MAGRRHGEYGADIFPGLIAMGVGSLFFVDLDFLPRSNTVRAQRHAGLQTKCMSQPASVPIAENHARMKMLQSLALAAATIAATPVADVARADNYPTRPVSLIVPVPPGGAADFLARTIGAKLHEALGQPVVVVNRGGAGGTIASASVAKAEPDGYTLLLNSITTHGIGPHLYSNPTVTIRRKISFRSGSSPNCPCS